jgi:hypothetical protein
MFKATYLMRGPINYGIIKSKNTPFSTYSRCYRVITFFTNNLTSEYRQSTIQITKQHISEQAISNHNHLLWLRYTLKSPDKLITASWLLDRMAKDGYPKSFLYLISVISSGVSIAACVPG